MSFAILPRDLDPLIVAPSGTINLLASSNTNFAPLSVLRASNIIGFAAGTYTFPNGSYVLQMHIFPTYAQGTSTKWHLIFASEFNFSAYDQSIVADGDGNDLTLMGQFQIVGGTQTGGMQIACTTASTLDVNHIQLMITRLAPT
jgi:hypothetical protein